MKAVQGEVVLLSINGIYHVAATNMSVNVDSATKESTKYKQMAGGWIQKTVSSTSWGATSDHLICDMEDFDGLIDLVAARKEVPIVMAEAEIQSDGSYAKKASGWARYGNGIISISGSFANEEDATVSIKIDGSGALSDTAPGVGG
jgi:hypothetical protein